jgi:hypothetical protein
MTWSGAEGCPSYTILTIGDPAASSGHVFHLAQPRLGPDGLMAASAKAVIKPRFVGS